MVQVAMAENPGWNFCLFTCASNDARVALFKEDWKGTSLKVKRKWDANNVIVELMIDYVLGQRDLSNSSMYCLGVLFVVSSNLLRRVNWNETRQRSYDHMRLTALEYTSTLATIDGQRQRVPASAEARGLSLVWEAPNHICWQSQRDEIMRGWSHQEKKNKCMVLAKWQPEAQCRRLWTILGACGLT